MKTETKDPQVVRLENELAELQTQYRLLRELNYKHLLLAQRWERVARNLGWVGKLPESVGAHESSS